MLSHWNYFVLNSAVKETAHCPQASSSSPHPTIKTHYFIASKKKKFCVFKVSDDALFLVILFLLLEAFSVLFLNDSFLIDT